MVEFNSPAFFGFEVTVWFALFCISLVCALIFLVLLCVGIFNKANKEDRIIVKATDNVAKIPVKKISMQNLNSSVMSGNVESKGNYSEYAPEYNTEGATPRFNNHNALWGTQTANDNVSAVGFKADFVQENENKNKFCIYCGKPAEGRFCIYCGKELN